MLRTLFLAILFVELFSAQNVLASHAPVPSPAPESGADVGSSPQATPPAPVDRSPAPAPAVSSPPAPPPASPAPSPRNANDLPSEESTPSPSPAPAPDAEDANDVSHASELQAGGSSGGGMSGGKKAGIAVGVVAGACVVGLGALVYKKRQQNIRRSQYGYAARRDIL